MLDIPRFIAAHVTGRTKSLFQSDMERCETELHARIFERSVLVIGGAGTIGGAFVREILKFGPARLVVVDTNENALTELVRDLRSSAGVRMPPVFLTYPMDFGDPVFERFFRREGPFHIVANFAAHKHVRSEKDPYSMAAMLHNNIFKAKHLLELLSGHAPERFFCVSTDKAAAPVNVMGASKKIMEQVLATYSAVFSVSTARFANVAFSNGSLPAGFLARLEKRQPLSVPLDVTRYFLSPEESGQLCLLACMLGQSGDIFIPKLDPARDVRTFSQIATALLDTLGFQAEICASEQEAREKAALLTELSHRWPVYFFHSDTSGEKLEESFYTAAEQVDWSRFEALGVVKNTQSSPAPEMAQLLDELKALLEKDRLEKAEIIALMRHFLPEFEHLETGKGLDAKM
jgi:FlaA1/EpsC-like NDP-sugar epimerase